MISLELEYFSNQVQIKLNQPKSTWTQAEKKLLPVLVTRLNKREKPIKQEIKMHQKKIQALEVDVNKAFQVVHALKSDYQSSKEMYEIFSEKASILD